MATFRIFEDQENVYRGNPGKENIHAAKLKDRRPLTFLGNEKKEARAKAPFEDLTNKENEKNKKPVAWKTAPSVPVAQFEAFKVYEDEENGKPTKDDAKSKFTKTATGNEETALEKYSDLQIHEKEKIENSSLEKKRQKDIDMSISETPLSEKPEKESPMSVSSALSETAPSSQPAWRADRTNIFDLLDYRSEIYSYLREAEQRGRPKPQYMKKQPDITYSMRTILVDWLVEVAEEYKLQSETLYLAVSFIDRFLSKMSVIRAKLQLVGTAAMFIASKYEEIYPPDVGEFVYITDDTYTVKQVLRMEHLVLRVLDFDVSIPTPLTFIKHICTTLGFDDKLTALAMFISELSLLEGDPYLSFLPSQIAAASVALARCTLDEEKWNSSLEDITSYAFDELESCYKCLLETFMNTPTRQQQAIQEKYKSSKFHSVALLLPQPDINHKLKSKNNI